MMRSLCLLALLSACVCAAAFQGEQTIGPYRISPDASWQHKDDVTLFGLAGSRLVQQAQEPKVALHLARDAVAFRDDKERQRLLSDLARHDGEQYPDGFRADTVKLAGVTAVRTHFVAEGMTVWRMRPFNAERIFTVTLVVAAPNAEFPEPAKKLLATLRLPDPPYKAPKRDFLSGLMSALDNVSKELDKINSALSGKPAKQTDTASKPDAGAGNQPPTTTGGRDAVLSKDTNVAVSVPWVKIEPDGSTQSPGLAQTDRLWSPTTTAPPEKIQGAEPIALTSELDLRELARTTHAGHARVAAAALYELAGPMSPEESARLQAKLAPALVEPTPETEAYFESLIPVLQQQLGLRAAAATAAEEFDAAWFEARMAAALGAEDGVREALDIADRQRETLESVQARTAGLAVQARKAGPVPNPIALRAQTAAQHEATVKAVMEAIQKLSAAPPKAPVKTVAWNYSGKAPANWTVTKTRTGLKFERKKVETPKVEGHWQSSCTAVVEVELPVKVAPNDKPANPADAAQLADANFKKRPQGFTPNDPAVGLDKQGGIEGASGFSISEFQGAIADYAIWRRRGSWGSGYTPGYSGAGGEGWVFSEGYRISFRYSVFTGSCFDNCQKDWENAQALAAQREARAILASLNPKGTGVFETTPETPAGGDDPMSKVPANLQAMVQLHTANIRFIKGTIDALQKQMAAESDPQRRAQLQWELLHAQSDLMAEEDLIQSQLTGQIIHRRGPFEEYAQQRFVQSIREDQQKMERFQRAQAALQRLAGMLPSGEAEAARALIDRQIDRKALASMDMEKVRRVAEALSNKVQGYAQANQAAEEEKAAWADYVVKLAEDYKSVADKSMFVASLFGGKPVMLAYQAATGYVEGGPLESVLRTAAWCGTPAYVATEAFRGYTRVGPNGEREGWTGAAKDAAVAYVTGKLFEYGVGKAAKWAKGKGAVTAEFGEQEVAEFNRRRAAGERTSRDFMKAQADLLAAGERGASAQEITRLQQRATRAAAAVNEDPHAKNFLKYRGNPAAQRAYNAHMRATHAEVEAQFHENMDRRGWNRQPMQEFRNASSSGSVGMDYDIGRNAAMAPPPMKGGKPATLNQWQSEAQQAWDEAYQKVTGRSSHRSWETVTTSQHAEAYKDLAWLSEDKTSIRKVWSQQAADVTRYKNWHMASSSGLDTVTAMQENCRGTAKDIGTKLMGLFQKARPANAASAQALNNAQKHWAEIQKVMEAFGRNDIDPVSASRRIRQLTGGKDIPQVLDDAAMMIESLGKHVGT